jgi:hypothetical protein
MRLDEGEITVEPTRIRTSALGHETAGKAAVSCSDIRTVVKSSNGRFGVTTVEPRP